MKKKVLSIILTATMILGLTACGSKQTANAGGDAAAPEAASEAASEAAPEAGSGDLIKVGIINNDPNESGYRTAMIRI